MLISRRNIFRQPHVAVLLGWKLSTWMRRCERIQTFLSDDYWSWIPKFSFSVPFSEPVRYLIRVTADLRTALIHTHTKKEERRILVQLAKWGWDGSPLPRPDETLPLVLWSPGWRWWCERREGSEQARNAKCCWHKKIQPHLKWMYSSMYVWVPKNVSIKGKSIWIICFKKWNAWVKWLSRIQSDIRQAFIFFQF